MKEKKIPKKKVVQAEEEKKYELVGVDGKKIHFPNGLAWANYIIAHCDNIHEILEDKKP